MYPYNIWQAGQNGKQNDVEVMANENAVENINNRADQKIIDMLLMAMKNENKDKNYYEQLSKKIRDREDSNIVYQIALDEQKHYKYLAQIYKRLTKQTPSVQFEQAKLGDNLADEFAISIFDELGAVEFYRRLMFLFLDLQIRDMFYEIITDEQAHATKFNYLYSKYAVKENENN